MKFLLCLIGMYIDILESSFPGCKQAIKYCEQLGFPWGVSELFLKKEREKILAHVAVLGCSIFVEGKKCVQAGAIHAVCTHEDYQGKGFATELLQEALEWSKERYELVFLFTAIPAFYERLSFRYLQEYRFHLSTSHPKGPLSLRSVMAPNDNTLFLRCFQQRESVSDLFWVQDNGTIASFNTLFSTYPIYENVYYSEAMDGFLCYRLEGKTWHILDIVVKQMPSLTTLLAHAPADIEDIYFYFSPDKLTQTAIPEAHLYDEGALLVHGIWPCTKPCMIAPLSRC